MVGRDAEAEVNATQLLRIAEQGHEIANHSFNHDPWLHLYSADQLREELALAEKRIAGATGRLTTGFRGPGFSLTTTTLEVLLERGYQYDATVFPNLLNPLARLYFFAHSKLSPEERKRREALFGTWREALQPIKPFEWNLEGGTLLEIPVTTMPFFKLPIHFSYILYLARFSKFLALTYFRWTLWLCRLSGTAPSLLLHPLDFMGAEDAPRLKFFPGMDMGRAYKLGVIDQVLTELRQDFQVVTMQEHAALLRAQGSALATQTPNLLRSV